jgi:calcium channel MID1
MIAWIPILSTLLGTVAAQFIELRNFQDPMGAMEVLEPMSDVKVRAQNNGPLIPRDLAPPDFGNAIAILDDIPTPVSLSPGQRSLYRYDFSTLNDTFYSLYFLTANVVQYPKNISRTWSDDELQDLFGLYIYSNQTQFASHEQFEQGYLSDIFYYGNQYDIMEGSIYIEPYFKANTSLFDSSDTVSYVMAISQKDLIFQWDNSTLASLIDTDDDSVYFQSGAYNLSSQTLYRITNESDLLQLQVFDQKGYDDLSGLLRSWSAVSSAQTVIPRGDVQISYSNSSGQYKLQLYVEGLEPSTSYYGILTFGLGTVDYNGAVYQAVNFSTMAAGACELIFDLEFCDDVAYSVPQSDDFVNTQDMRALKILYDAYAAAIYDNFTLAMQQIACDAGLDSRYSPIATCDDCLQSYKNWLCSVTIPRCTTRNSSYYMHREKGEMRTDELAARISPPSSYYEVMPCIDLCYSMARNCPADFNFGCPGNSTMIKMSYYYYDYSMPYTTCNMVGDESPVAELESGSNVLKTGKLWFILSLYLLII